MYVKCWQCSQDIETFSVEKNVVRNVISMIKRDICNDGQCSLLWRHEDCLALTNIILSLKEKYEFN